MHMVNLASAALLSAILASAAPLGQEDVSPSITTLVKRVQPHEVSCGPHDNNHHWPLQDVHDAFDALVTNGRLSKGKKAKAGTREYPQQFGKRLTNENDPGVKHALDAIHECRTGQAGMKYFEFPITHPVFAGNHPQGAQGPDRVIAISPSPGIGGTRQYTYCLALTHRGQPGGAFTPCT